MQSRSKTGRDYAVSLYQLDSREDCGPHKEAHGQGSTPVSRSPGTKHVTSFWKVYDPAQHTEATVSLAVTGKNSQIAMSAVEHNPLYRGGAPRNLVDIPSFCRLDDLAVSVLLTFDTIGPAQEPKCLKPKPFVITIPNSPGRDWHFFVGIDATPCMEHMQGCSQTSPIPAAFLYAQCQAPIYVA